MSLETDMLWAQQLYLATDFFSYLQGRTYSFLHGEEKPRGSKQELQHGKLSGYKGINFHFESSQQWNRCPGRW